MIVSALFMVQRYTLEQIATMYSYHFSAAGLAYFLMS